MSWQDQDVQQDVDDAGEGVVDQEPALPELDPEVKAQVEAFYARQADQQRAALTEYGLDLASDGKPVIRDPRKFSEWSGAGVRAAAPQPAPQPVPAAAAATPAPADDDPPDLFSMDGRQLMEFVERRAEKIADKKLAPLQEQFQNAQAMLHRRVVNDAMGHVRDVVTKHAPYLEGVLDHPDFEEVYRQSIQGVDPAMLEDAQNHAGMIGFIAARLDPHKMPKERSRDGQGRFVQGMVNRSNIPQTPSRDAGRAEPQQSAGTRNQGWLDFCHAAGIRATDGDEWDALNEIDPEWGIVTLDSFKAAREKQVAKNGRR